jgi:flagellar protein FlaG
MEVFSATKLANDGTGIAKQVSEDNVKNIAKSNNQEAKNDSKNKVDAISEEEVNQVVKKMNEDLAKLEQSLEFSYNDDIKQMMITVKNRDDGEVIRTIPTEEAIEISKKMKDIVGSIFDKKG